MAADQLGYSYADQVFMLSKAAPWGIDYLVTMFQETNVLASYTWLTDHGNQLFGSANPNEVPS
jgi:hypothetical protein